VHDITLSVVCHGHGKLLHSLLCDLNSFETLAGASVVVTLNLPSDQIDPREYPNLRLHVIRNRRRQGFARNHNAAFSHCATTWFAVLNPDLRMPIDPFASMIRLAERDPRTALVAPVVTDSAGNVEDSVRTNLSPTSLLFRRLSPRATARSYQSHLASGEFCWFGGMFMLFRASAFRAVRGFDERFFLYCEDYDICARLHLEGYTLQLESGSRVIHDAQRTSHRSARHLGWHLRSLFRVWSSRPFWRITLGR